MTRFYQTFAFLVLIACQQTQPPYDVLTLDQMALIVEEITIIETHYQSRYGVPIQYKKALDKSVDQALVKAGCTRKKFKKSLRYYAAHPELQKSVNEVLLTNMSRKLN
jgi:hypothetical protein